MKIYSVKNSSYDSKNQNFKALKINSQEIHPWNPNILEDFVKNKEVQKLVKILHGKGKDVVANYRDYTKGSATICIKLDLLDREKDYNKCIADSFEEIKYTELNKFNALKSIRAYEEREKDNILSQEKMQNALDFVDRFNSSLDKKWWQFWKV